MPGLAIGSTGRIPSGLAADLASFFFVGIINNILYFSAERLFPKKGKERVAKCGIPYLKFVLYNES